MYKAFVTYSNDTTSRCGKEEKVDLSKYIIDKTRDTTISVTSSAQSNTCPIIGGVRYAGGDATLHSTKIDYTMGYI